MWVREKASRTRLKGRVQAVSQTLTQHRPGAWPCQLLQLCSEHSHLATIIELMEGWKSEINRSSCWCDHGHLCGEEKINHVRDVERGMRCHFKESRMSLRQRQWCSIRREVRTLCTGRAADTNHRNCLLESIHLRSTKEARGVKRGCLVWLHVCR